MSDRIGDGHYVYWASLYAATCLTLGCGYAALREVCRTIWR